MSGADDAAVAAVKRLADACVDILHTTLVSAILHGSLTTDGFWPGRSDLDLLLVERRPGPGEDLDVEGRDDQVPDLWPELSETRANGRSLLGPEPGEVIGEVPRDRVRANGIGWLTTWLDLVDDDKNAVHMVLTACRIWR